MKEADKLRFFHLSITIFEVSTYGLWKWKLGCRVLGFMTGKVALAGKGRCMKRLGVRHRSSGEAGTGIMATTCGNDTGQGYEDAYCDEGIKFGKITRLEREFFQQPKTELNQRYQTNLILPSTIIR